MRKINYENEEGGTRDGCGRERSTASTGIETGIIRTTCRNYQKTEQYQKKYGVTRHDENDHGTV